MSTQALESLRQQGNALFAKKQYDGAVQLYSQAIEECTVNDSEELVLSLCNRSACYYIMEDYDAALADAQRAYDLCSTTMGADTDGSQQRHRLKAAFRLVKTMTALHQYDEAKRIIQTSLQQIAHLQIEEGEANDETTTTTSTASPKDELQSTSAFPTKAPPTLDQQHQAFTDLYHQVLQAALSHSTSSSSASRHQNAKIVSIRDFVKGREIGFGNFSQILEVTYKQQHPSESTSQPTKYALKLILKSKCETLAKRQHPNVWNEVAMERHVLLERLQSDDNGPYCPYVVSMLAAFSDYEHFYYLMPYYPIDLWSQLKYHKKLVGCHPSQIRVWMYQLVDALEFMHSHGVVHRDLKPENILLQPNNDIVVIDFGTAKDLIDVQYNGPEFVGTPDFMSPEAVAGTSGLEEAREAVANGQIGATHAADLWALGAILYILYCGKTPFWSPSPYLGFLKIKRGLLLRDGGIYDDDAWDLIQQLVRLDPSERVGASAFELVISNDKQNGKGDTSNGTDNSQQRRIVASPGKYDCIRQHEFFANVDILDNPQQARKRVRVPVPSLRDLCVRAVAEQVVENAGNLQLMDDHPPGDGSQYDLLRLSKRDRAAVLHVLDRQQLLRDPRIFARFSATPIERLNGRVRPITRDLVGWTQLNDDQGKAPNATMNDPYAKPIEMDAIEVVQITSHLLDESTNTSMDEHERKVQVKLFKRCIACINRMRPKLVIVAGYIDDKCRKLLTRVSETIPVAIHDGSAFFSAWFLGVQCLCLQVDDTVGDSQSEQVRWIREQLEQVRMSKHPLFVFCNSNPTMLPKSLLQRLARGRTLAVYGATGGACGDDNSVVDMTIDYRVNVKGSQDNDDDLQSVRSTDSEEDERDSFTTIVKATNRCGLRIISVDPEPDSWKERFESMSVVKVNLED